jgi:succinate-semialdehyde dehydrogenase/glutarate-semialdehyde dehydrogenase
MPSDELSAEALSATDPAGYLGELTPETGLPWAAFEDGIKGVVTATEWAIQQPDIGTVSASCCNIAHSARLWLRCSPVSALTHTVRRSETRGEWMGRIGCMAHPVTGLGTLTPRSVEAFAAVPRGLLVGGAWCEAADGSRFGVEDPATEQIGAYVADATGEDARRALSCAVATAGPWSRTSSRARGDLLGSAFDALVARTDDFALVITTEMGKPLGEARAEVAYAADYLRWYAEEAVRTTGRACPAPEGTSDIVVTSHPVGPCYLITPWNFPLAMATRKIAPALAAGCTVVLKPADLTPLTALLFGQLLLDVGLPAGVVNILPTTRPAEVTEALLGDSGLRKLSFTGSTAVGRQLLAQAAPRVLRTSMELGGNAPFVVFEDADVDAAVAGAMQAKFRNAGQACTAANRFLVHERVYDQFSARLVARVRALRVGPGAEEGTDIGPLIDARAVAKVAGLVERAVAAGATQLAGGAPVDRAGHFFAPTVMGDVAADSEIAREEVFGPVVTLTPFADEAEAVAFANDTEYGLASYVYTRDLARARRMVSALDTGMTGVNVGAVSNAAAPFGGVKQSGLGREGGPEGLLEYLDVKYAAYSVNSAVAVDRG